MKICVPDSFVTDLSEIEDEELFTVDNPSESVLSADAIPYRPRTTTNHPYNVNVNLHHPKEQEPIEVAIYCNGVPCLTLPTEADRSNILHGIPDEAIFDEGCFPLDANDAAELEATDEFVIEMANLELLEELEEQARTTFNHIQKRWEARRKAGPTGRPRPCMHLIVAKEHLPVSKKTELGSSSTSSTSVVQLFSNGHRGNHIDEKMRVKEILHAHNGAMERPNHLSKKGNTTSKNGRRTIQQPRKDS